MKRLKSFAYAFNGLKILLKEEVNARIHFFAASVVFLAGWYVQLSTIEWCCIVLAIGLVISFEIINSSIENIADFISPEKHDMIKKIKDLAAASVLISALTAFIIGIIIFLPKLFQP